MGVQLAIRIVSILWMLKMSRGALLSWEKPNCQSSCGSISIAYPFGIGANCYFNKWYEIECKEIEKTSYPYTELKPYIKSLNLEFKSSLFIEKLLTPRLFDELRFSVCNDGFGYDYKQVLNTIRVGVPPGSKLELEGTPFFVSNTGNVFVGVGCNIVAYMTDQNENTIAWCASVCGSDSEPHPCEASVKENLQTFRSKIQTFETNFTINQTSTLTNSANSSCRQYTFLAEQSWYDSVFRSSSNYCSGILDQESVPILMGFMLNFDVYSENMTEKRSTYTNNMSTSCEKGRPMVEINNVVLSNQSVQCSCRSGYFGNPYLPSGCISFDEEKKINWTTIIIGVSSAVGALLLMIGGWCLYKIVGKKITKRKKERFFKQNGGLLLQQHMSSSDGNVDKTKVFNSYELDQATDHYNANRVLGQGGQGTVYKGMLFDGRIVAVKKSKIADTTNVEQFINEVVILSQINQRNIVKLLGCCLETEVPLLVYEFISNGTLFQHIHNPNEDFPLTWEIRLRIATEIAWALSYLHFAASMPIYHRDIKSTNILLDDKYKARVCDFGTSRSVDVDKTHWTTKVQGTFGSLDPEFFRTSQFTDKSDVYSFGVVLVELLTGNKPIFSSESQEVRGLAAHFLEEMEEDRFVELIDPRILNENKIEEMVAVAHIAEKCLNLNGRGRPTMKEVASRLEGIRMSQEQFMSHGNFGVAMRHDIDIGVSYDGYSTSTDTWCKSTTTLS